MRLEKRLVDKPVLHEALVQGKVSLNKLARVISIATAENQEELLGKVEVLSKVALDVFVKDYKQAHWSGGMGNAEGFGELQGGLFEGGVDNLQGGALEGGFLKPQMGRIMDGSQKPQNWQTVLYGQNENGDLEHRGAIEKSDPEQGGHLTNIGTSHDTREGPKTLPVNLDEDIAKELLEMQSKNIDVNELLREFLRVKKEKHAREIAEIVEKQMQERDDRATIGYPANRHIPAAIRKIIRYEFGDKCSSPGCTKSAKNLHHERGFALDNCHDPRYLKPLCKGHHELAHTVEYVKA